MDSRKTLLDEITVVVHALTQKMEALQEKVDELCKSTGDCSYIKEAHEDLLSSKQNDIHGTNIDTLCKKE